MRRPHSFRTLLTAGLVPAVIGLVITTTSTHSQDVGPRMVPPGPTPGPVTTPVPPAVPAITDYFATCIADGTCAAAPTQSPICPTGLPGQACQMCQYQRTKQQCVNALTQTCVFSDLGGTVTGCGTQWIGVCIGPGLACIAPTATGSCSRIICTSGPIL